MEFLEVLIKVMSSHGSLDDAYWSMRDAAAH